MAKSPEAKVTVKITSEEKKEESKPGLAIPLAVLTILALLAGGGIGWQLTSTVRNTLLQRAAEAPAAPAPLRYSSDMAIESFKPILTNLAAPSGAFVRIEGSIVFKPAEMANPQVAAGQIREDIATYFRTLTLSQLSGPSALQNLREDLNERAKLRVDGKLVELLIESLVVQ